MTLRRRAAMIAAVIGGVGAMTVGALSGARPAAAGGGDLLPDLSLMRPADIRIETTGGGARRLRFTSTIANIGDGPFETRASRSSTAVSTMGVSQRVYQSGGGTRVHPGSAIATYSGDGHNHWHVQRVARYDLFAVTPGGPSLRRDAKVGFCFFDTNTYNLTLRGAPSSRQYLESGCGTSSTLSTTNGISIGWSDRYPWNFAYQWITITGLAGGEYYLKYTVDPNGDYLEKIEKNNCTWARLRIPSSGSTVTVLASGWGCVLPGTPTTPTPLPTGRVVVPPRTGG